MKKILLLSTLALFICFQIHAQSLTLKETVQFPFVTNQFGDVGSSDCWGWTDGNGVDYAIMGNVDNVAFVRASDGQVLDQVPAASGADAYYHRDMVTYGNYCYAVSEMTGVNEGLMIFDLSYLPDSVHFVGTWTDNGNLIRSHNVDIDTATGHLYIEGDQNGGIDIVSLANPVAPVKVGFVSVPGVHDMHARNDTLWVAEGYASAYSVYDVSDKGNPGLMGRIFDTNFGYCHNIWPSDDGRFFYTTEETPNKSVKVWDATDMNNIIKRGEYLGGNNLAHNVHVMNNLLFISHYTAGVTVVDVSDPDIPVELAAYDTYAQNDIADFYGCWGAFPYTNNDYVYASNFEGKLFILEWDATVGIENQQERQPGLAWPNPFTQVTNIPFELTAPANVSVQVFDMQGNLVSELMNQGLTSGSYTIPWRPDATVAAGTYLVKLEGGNVSGVKKVELIR